MVQEAVAEKKEEVQAPGTVPSAGRDADEEVALCVTHTTRTQKERVGGDKASKRERERLEDTKRWHVLWHVL